MRMDFLTRSGGCYLRLTRKGSQMNLLAPQEKQHAQKFELRTLIMILMQEPEKPIMILTLPPIADTFLCLLQPWLFSIKMHTPSGKARRETTRM